MSEKAPAPPEQQVDPSTQVTNETAPPANTPEQIEQRQEWIVKIGDCAVHIVIEGLTRDHRIDLFDALHDASAKSKTSEDSEDNEINKAYSLLKGLGELSIRKASPTEDLRDTQGTTPDKPNVTLSSDGTAKAQEARRAIQTIIETTAKTPIDIHLTTHGETAATSKKEAPDNTAEAQEPQPSDKHQELLSKISQIEEILNAENAPPEGSERQKALLKEKARLEQEISNDNSASSTPAEQTQNAQSTFTRTKSKQPGFFLNFIERLEDRYFPNVFPKIQKTIKAFSEWRLDRKNKKTQMKNLKSLLKEAKNFPIGHSRIMKHDLSKINTQDYKPEDLQSMNALLGQMQAIKDQMKSTKDPDKILTLGGQAQAIYSEFNGLLKNKS